MRIVRLSLPVAVLALAVSAWPMVTRGQILAGSLTGAIVDTAGARVAGARVELVEVETSLARHSSSDASGAFRLDNLRPGRYRLTVSAKGFEDAVSEVDVMVSSVRDVTVTLRPAKLQQTVSVQGTASSVTTEPINAATAVHQATITEQDLNTIPLAARSFANMAYLAPGTEPVEPSDPTKARITAVSSGGSSGLNIELSVDGGDNSDDYIGGFLQNFSPDTIQEFAVRTAQEDADTSRTTGASVVVTTKHGTDNWHGGGSFYERAAALNARFPIDNPPPNPKQPFSRQNYVGTLGGPIARGKVWFFSSIEAVHEDASIAYSAASLAQFQALAQLASDGVIPGVSSIPVPSNVPVPFRDYLGTTRFDWAESKRSQWFLRAAVDNYTTHNALVQQAALPSTGATSHNNYMNLVISNQTTFSATWLGSFVFDASGLHLTEGRNSNLGFALAFPFTATSSTISGLETFGDNQFVTPITAFPVLRNQEKYQFRYDVSHAMGSHSPRFGVNFIHEPVLSGALAATQENFVTFPEDPTFYIGNLPQFVADYAAGSAITPAGNGSFSQDVQRLGLYAEDSWRITPRLIMNYGLRYETTFGLFTASGQSQSVDPALLTLNALQIPLVSGVPHDYRGQVGPRLGIAYSPSSKTVIRAGFGLFYNDLAQNGWVTAFQAVNQPTGSCALAGLTLVGAACLPSAAAAGPIGNVAGSGAIIDPRYKTPYAIHATGGVEHAFNAHWTLAADYTHEEGNHAYRRYQYQAGYTLFSPLFPQDVTDQRNNVPNITVFRTDNRSSYNALAIHLQGNVTRRFDLVANYTLSSAKTWGCVLGELFDYVNGVCNPLRAFGPGDYGPSGEDVLHRFVFAGTLHVPGGFEVTTLTQAESARPFTLTTSVPVTGLGDGVDDRAVVNGTPVGLDTLRGTPYIQVDLRVSRPFNIRERWSVTPFIEFFNLFNRNNPGANYVTDVAALPVPQNEVQNGNVTNICTNPACTSTQPITSLNQLRVAGGALGDFFGPGTTVGIPFAGQLGVRFSF
jgi:hypothetical protein